MTASKTQRQKVLTLDLAEEGVPEPRPREPSHTVGVAASMTLKSLLRDHLDDSARTSIGGVVQELVDAQVEEIKSAMTRAQHQANKDAPNARQTVWPWVAVLVVVCVAIGTFGALMWGSLRDLQVQRASDYAALQKQRTADHDALSEETRLRNEQRNEDLSYDRVLAHWLVLSNNDSFENFKNQDTMLRRIAKAVKVKVDDVDKPTKKDPPREVSVKHLQAPR